MILLLNGSFRKCQCSVKCFFNTRPVIFIFLAISSSLVFLYACAPNKHVRVGTLSPWCSLRCNVIPSFATSIYTGACSSNRCSPYNGKAEPVNIKFNRPFRRSNMRSTGITFQRSLNFFTSCARSLLNRLLRQSLAPPLLYLLFPATRH